MDYMAILIMLCVSLFSITYKHIHYALLKRAIYNKRYEIAIFMRFFSRFVDLLRIWGVFLFILFIISLIDVTFKWDIGTFFLGAGFVLIEISLVYILYHLFKAIISITNYHYHFGEYILYLRSFKDDISAYKRRFVTAIQEYTNLKMLGIGDPSMLHHDTSFTDSVLQNDANLSVVFRTERTWKNTVTKLMRKSQFILVKVDDTDGVMYEIKYALTNYANKVIFLIEEKEDLSFLKNQLGDKFKMSEYCSSIPALAFVIDGVIEISPITNIGMSLQYCFNHMGKSISYCLHDVDAEELYWQAWDIYHSSRFETPTYASLRKYVCRLLWKSYCNGCEKAAELLKTTLSQYPELKNVWCENLFYK